MTQFANRVNINVKFTVKNVTSNNKVVAVFNRRIGPGRSQNLLEIPGVDEAAIAASLLKGDLRRKLDVGELEVTVNTTSIGVKDKEYSDYLKSKNLLDVYSGSDLPEAYDFAPGASVWYTDTNSPIYSDGTTWRDANGTDISMIPLTAISSDYIIVGLGTAGSAIARLLTDDMTTSVTVLESGQNRNAETRVQQGAPLGDTSMSEDPAYAFQRAVNPANVRAPLTGYRHTDGRIWGGGSSVNFLLSVRGDPSAYDAWGDIDSQWSYSSLLPIMKKLEYYTPNGTTADTSQRGTSGYLRITQDPPLPDDPFYTAIVAAANAPKADDYFLEDATVGLFACQWYVDNTNKRYNAIRAFLPESVMTTEGKGVGERKLEVISQATVIEVIIKNMPGGIKKAVGVRFFYNNEPGIVREAYANKKVILCAGTLATPKILQLSGVGPRALLESVGIPVKVANDNVGSNLQNHIGPPVVLPMDGFYPGFNVGQVFCDLSGDNTGQANDNVRRWQFITVPYFMQMSHILQTALGIQSANAISLIGFNMKPKSKTGKVEIVNQDPLAGTRITCNYLSDGYGVDLAASVRSLKVAANISMEYSGQMPLYPPTSAYPAPWGPAPNDTLLEEIVKDASLPAMHCSGTCRMGTSITNGVVDGNLDVFGVEGLSCADNSIVPEIETGNTAYQAYVIGMKKAEIEGAEIP